MKTINTTYNNKDTLAKFCQANQIPNSDKVLLQIFTGILDKTYIEKLLTTITEILPNINIIGTSTDGEIIDEKIISKSTVLSFMIFNDTAIKIYKTSKQKADFQTGKSLVQQFDNLSEAKVAIIFADGLHTNGEVLLKAFNKYAPNLKITGGLSGDNATFTNTYSFTKEGINNSGAVAAVLYNPNLIVNTSFSFGWEEIGKELTVTKAVENTVYTIDNMSATDIYKKYLGIEIEQKLPATGIEFPLILNRNGNKIARAVVGKNEDGSLVFAGNIKKGDKVYLGYGNIDHILDNRFNLYKELSNTPVESIFIYSCMARKRLLGDDIKNEIIPLSKIAPTSGCFTYGEFYCYCNNNASKNNLFNQTMTVMTLSESSNFKVTIEDSNHHNRIDNIQTVKALSHLISVTSKELNSLNKNLDKQVQEKTKDLQELNDQLEIKVEERTNDLAKQKQNLENAEKIAKLGTWSYNLTENKLIWSNEIFNIFGLDKDKVDPSYQLFLEMIYPDDREKVKNVYTQSLLNKTPYSTKHRILLKSGQIKWVQEEGTTNYDNEGNPILTLGTVQDITDKHEKEEFISRQSKMAAMGEMIGNIAHQWRQPLNNISLYLQFLKDQYKINLKEFNQVEKYFERSFNQIEYMSQTIDDFRRFLKDEKDPTQYLLDDNFNSFLKLVESTSLSNNINIFIENNIDIEVTGYPNELIQCYINIFNNANDALLKLETEKYFFITTKRNKENIIIKLKDNAGGISEEFLPKVFEPYFTTKDQLQGIGIGLHMTYKLITEGMHGTIIVNNVTYKYGEKTYTGAEFTITIPINS